MAAVSKLISHLANLKIRLGEISRTGTSFDFQPDDATRRDMAKTLGLVSLSTFEAHLDVSLWLDGAEVRAKWTGAVVQTCGLSLEDFETRLSGAFTVRVAPSDSINAPALEGEVDLDPDADDPPDVLDSDEIDLGAYVVEHLGLELDPFPKKPGAVFETSITAAVISPFASLKDLKS